MNNSVQIALFFEEGTVYNPAIISAKIIEKFSELGNPILLPINTEAPKEANVPFIIFNQNVNFQLVLNYHNMLFTFQNSYIKQAKDIAITIFEVFNKEKINFVRIGYVPTFITEEEKKKDFEHKYVCQEELKDVVDYQFSWLKRIKIKDLEFNCWERSISDSNKIKGLLKIYDFNTDADIIIKIDKKFIKDFIDFCDKYMNK